ncbi:MAG: twin-arginine translocation signal domain-containing protein, partial [Paraburkholderia sp.]
MKRRDFLSMTTAAGAALWLPRAFGAQGPTGLAADPAVPARGGYGNLLILVELKGGNDGLNTV